MSAACGLEAPFQSIARIVGIAGLDPLIEDKTFCEVNDLAGCELASKDCLLHCSLNDLRAEAVDRLSLAELLFVFNGVDLLAPIFVADHSFLGGLILTAYVDAAVLIVVISGHIKLAYSCAAVKAAFFDDVLVDFSLKLDSQKVLSRL